YSLPRPSRWTGASTVIGCSTTASIESRYIAIYLRVWSRYRDVSAPTRFELGGCEVWPERLSLGKRCRTHGQDHFAGDPAPSGGRASRFRGEGRAVVLLRIDGWH